MQRKIDRQLDREIRILCWCYEWYWSQILAEYKKEENYWSYHSLPKVYLLHWFYGEWKDTFQHFDNYDYWQEAFLFLGRPICRSFPFLSWSNCYWKIANLFLKKERIPRKWQRHFSHDCSTKWQRQYETDKETADRKKEAREKKKEWRRKLGKDRDQGKGKRREMYAHDNPRRDYKRLRSRSYRQWIKQNIQRENFDIFLPLSKDRILFYDWRIWGW